MKRPRSLGAGIGADAAHDAAMPFAFSTIADLLGWLAVLLLAIKAGATVVLLRRDRQSWFRHRWSATLWWATKMAPVLAVPCLIAAAAMQRRIGDAWGYGALMVFVLVAIPIVVWRRFRRPAGALATSTRRAPTR